MKIINFMKKNNYNILLPFLGIISFTTWFFKFDFIINIYIYFSILLILTLLRQSVSSMMLVSLFSVFATYSSEVYLLYQMIFVYVVIYFIFRNIKTLDKIKGSLFWPLVLLSGLSFISIFWSPNSQEGLGEFLIMIQGVVTYFVIVNDEESSVMTPKNIAWITSILLLVISLQYFLITYKYFPKAPNKSHLFSLWLNPNIVAAMLGLLWVPSLYKYNNIKENKLMLFYLPAELLIIYSIYMSMSRGLYFGYLIGVIATILLFIKVKPKILAKIFYGLIGSIIIAISVVVISKDIYPLLYNKLNDFSTARFDIYTIALNRIKKPLTFLFGDGLGSANYYLDGNHYYHSWFLQSLATRGIIGLLLQILLLIKAFRMLDNNQKYSKYLMIGIIIYLSHSIVDVGFEYQILGILYYLMIGTLERNNFKMMKQNNMI